MGISGEPNKNKKPLGKRGDLPTIGHKNWTRCAEMRTQKYLLDM